MAIIPDTLGAALAYMKQTLDGAGALKGADGKDGKDGKSAYELAVDNGFEGTEEEWLKGLNPSNIVTVSNSPFESHTGHFKLNEIIAGESQQFTTSGKNLLDCSGLTEQTINGVTFTPVYENGMLQYINVNGTATGLVNYTVATTTYIANQEYVLSGCPSGGGGSTYKIKATNDSKYADYGNGVTFSYTEDTSSSVIIVVYSGTTISNIKFYPMLRDSSIGDATCEPYTGGIPSPNPDYPQEIEKTVVSEIKTHGKNFFSKNTSTLGYYSPEGVLTSSTVWFIQRLDARNIDKIVMSGIKKFGTAVVAETENGIAVIGNNGNSVYDVSAYDTIIYSVHKDDFTTSQVEMGEVATAYEPYTESVVKLSKPVELYGIGDVKDTIENGKVIRRFKAITLTGNEAWKLSVSGTTYYYVTSDGAIKGGSAIISSHFKRGQWNALGKDEICMGNTQGGMLGISAQSFSSLDELKSFLSNNEVKAVYELAEEATEELPFADKAALNSLSTYSDITYLEFDSEIEPGFKGETAVTQEGAYILDVLHSIKDDYAVVSESPITDSFEGRLKVEEIVAGESQQFTTTGAQLFDASRITTTSLGGATVTNNGDGSFTVSGSGTLIEQFAYQFTLSIEETKRLFKSGVLKRKDIAATVPYLGIQFVDDSEQVTALSLVNITETEGSVDITSYIEGNYRVRFLLYATAGREIVPGTFKPMFYQDGDGTYEPYTGGVASPNPSYPQEIKKTVVSEIRTHRKNFLKNTATSKTVNGVTFTVNDDGSVTVVGTATNDIIYKLNDFANDDRDLILSGCPSGGSKTTYKLYLYHNKSLVNDFGENGVSVPKDGVNYAVRIIIYANATMNHTFYPMIRDASTDDAYEPYTGSTITLSQPIELYGIGDVQDVIEDGKILRRFDVRTYDGDEHWKVSNTLAGRYYVESTGATSESNALCSCAKFLYLTSSIVANECMFSTSVSGRFMVNTDFETVEEWKAYLVENPMTLVYELAEEITEPLPIVDQMALNSLKTFDGITYLEFDSEIQPTFQVEYGATKNGGYILEGLLAGRNGELLQERIAALEATLVNNI